MKLLITGLPGCGKTTLCRKIIQALKDKKIGGILSEEIREGGERKGFKIIDIKTGAEGVLAHVAQKEGPRVGKYRVNLSDIDRFSGAIENDCDLVVIDEIGPMELHSTKFIRAVRAVFESGRSVVAAIHYKSKHLLVQELKHRKDVVTYEINEANRNKVLEEILRRFQG
jgi:nucleoside-triphosphatase